jgi:hypothetical protein
LQEALGAKLRGPLDWTEDPGHAGREFDLGESGWLALRLFAVYAERSDLELPETVPAIAELDRAWRAAADAKFANSHFGHLLAAELWLPLEFPFTFRAPLPDGAEAGIGSLLLLQDQISHFRRTGHRAESNEKVD